MTGRRRKPRGRRVDLFGDDSAVSTVLGYILTLTVTTVLITGLLVAGGGFVEDQRDRVVRTELRVLGERLTADVQRADRLVAATESPAGATVAITTSLPTRMAGQQYTITVSPDGPNRYTVTFETEDGITRDVSFVAATDVETGTEVEGGDVRIVWDPADTRIELEAV